mgnify:CR=1 FL=1
MRGLKSDEIDISNFTIASSICSEFISSTYKDLTCANTRLIFAIGLELVKPATANNVDVVIIDTPPKIESDARPAIEASDLVLIPMTQSHVDFWATEAIINIAKKAKKKIMIQINRANQRSKLIIKTNDYIKSLNVPSVNTIIGNRQIYASSMGEGKTAIEKQRKGSAVDEIKKLSEQILSELN